MSDALDALKRWISESPRRAIAAGAGAVALLGLALALSMGGEDVAPVLGAGAAEAPTVTGTPAATGAATVDGAVVAGTATPGTVAAPSSSASGSGSGSSGGGASAAALGVATETEKAMNEGLPEGRLTPEPGQPVETSDAVASTGAKLEQLAEKYSECLRSAKDYYDCLDELKGAKTERIYDSKPYGVLISVKASNGTVVRLSVRGDALCRMFKPGTTCDAWSSAG